MDNNDLNNAEKNIDDLFNLRDQLINSSPYLNDMKSRLQWYKKAITELPKEADNFFSLIDIPLQSILSINPSNLDYSSVTGATGSFYSVSADTRQIIASYGSQHYSLITEYENLKKTEDIIDEVIEILSMLNEDYITFHPEEILNEAKNSYAKWKAGAIDNSDLAGSTRSFQDIFKGCLAKAWTEISKSKPQAFSWNKMSETLAKKKGNCESSLIKVKNADDDFHTEFTEIFKKTKKVNPEEMDNIFKGYIEHLYSIINLIELDLLK
jgi:hypothetical protein